MNNREVNKNGIKVISKKSKIKENNVYAITVGDVCEKINKSSANLSKGGLVKIVRTNIETVAGVTIEGKEVTQHRTSLKKTGREFVPVKDVEPSVVKKEYNDTIEFRSNNDVNLCAKYINKADSSRKRGIPFELSFGRYKYLMNLKKCQYTGNRFVDDADSKDRRSLERIDNTLGYTDSNTIAVTFDINSFKSRIEDKAGTITYREVYSMCKKLDKLGLI